MVFKAYLVPRSPAERSDNRAHEVDPKVEMRHLNQKCTHTVQGGFRKFALRCV